MSEIDDLIADPSEWFSNEAATFGDRLAWAREALGMDQEELARRSGVTPETLVAWESDMSEPRANRLQMLSGMLNVSMSWLLTGEGEGPNVEVLESDEKDLTLALAEMRALRLRLLQEAERLAVLEKQLRRRVNSDEDIQDVL